MQIASRGHFNHSEKNYMTWYLIGTSNSITHYFDMKTVWFERKEYTF